MTIQDIIIKFELYLDDTSELSSSEELDLAQKIFNQIHGSDTWEIFKKEATGTTSTAVSYVALPDDFGYLIETSEYTDNSISYQGNSKPRIVYVGTGNRPYNVINWSDRRQYADKDGYCYVDFVNSRLYFTKQPTSAESYSFDYMPIPETLELTTTFPFPERFSDSMFHGMAVDGYIIQQFDKAKSYAKENMELYNNKIEEMKLWNASLINN
jgi:hypothetical protein